MSPFSGTQVEARCAEEGTGHPLCGQTPGQGDKGRGEGCGHIRGRQ